MGGIRFASPRTPPLGEVGEKTNVRPGDRIVLVATIMVLALAEEVFLSRIVASKWLRFPWTVKVNGPALLAASLRCAKTHTKKSEGGTHGRCLLNSAGKTVSPNFCEGNLARMLKSKKLRGKGLPRGVGNYGLAVFRSPRARRSIRAERVTQHARRFVDYLKIFVAEKKGRSPSPAQVWLAFLCPTP